VKSARVAVGHPVDVATGDQFTAAHDVEVFGYVPLVFRRFYHTASLADPPSVLGPGWLHGFEATLEGDLDGFTFRGHDGEQVQFDDWGNAFETTGSLVNLGASMELRREGDRIAVYHWHVPEDPVGKFVFERDQGDAFRFVARQLPSGHALDLTYDPQGRLSTVTQSSEGRRLLLLHDGAGRLAELHLGSTRPVWKPELRVARYSYDSRGRLVAVHDAAGFARSYDYDEGGRLILERDRRGGTYRMQYDSRGRCVETSGEDGFNRRRLIYEPGHFTRVIDAQDRETLFQYNAAGQVEREIQPDGAVRVTTLDDAGRIVAVIDPLGNTTRYSYDVRGNLAQKTEANGATVTYEYDDLHQPTRIVEGDGAVWTFRYERGALVEVVDPLGRVARYFRNGSNDVIGALTPAGRRLTVSTDASWTELTVSDDLGPVVRTRLDLRGNALEERDGRGLVVRFAYDPLGRLLEVVGADGARVRFEWDPEGALVRVVDARGGQWTARYSSHGQCLERTDPLGQTLGYGWNAQGHLTSLSNAKGEVARFDYDIADRVTAIHHFDGTTERGEYDKAGRLIRRTWPDGTTLAFELDQVGRTTRVTAGDQEVRRWKYDLRGNPVEAVSEASRVSFEYEVGGRLSAEEQNGRRIEYRYDEAGRMIRRALAGSKAGPLRTAHDLRGRMVSFATEGSDRSLQTFSYDLDDRVTERRLGETVERRSYDAAGRTSSQEVAGVVSRAYRRDPEGSLVEVVDSLREGRGYRYDLADQLVESSAGNQRHRYAYDANGNLIRNDGKTLDYERGDRLRAIGDTLLDRDANGRVTSVRSGGSETRFRWDALGQLRTVEHPDGTATALEYDAFGRRILKTHGGRVTSYWWSGNDLIAEGGEAALTEYAIRDAWPMAIWEDGTVHHVITTPQGVPHELLDPSGRVVWTARYDDRGGLVEETGPASCSLRLPGQMADRESGLHYNRFRYYWPEAGQFFSPDPVGFEAGPNLFRYAPNAIDWVDPLGLICVPITRRQLAMIETLRSGQDVSVRDIKEARLLLHYMPDLQPFNSHSFLITAPAPPGTFRGDLINTRNPTAPIHPAGSAPPAHANNPHYNLYFHTREKAAIIIPTD
jgi:RHS repeat-associated protein